MRSVDHVAVGSHLDRLVLVRAGDLDLVLHGLAVLRHLGLVGLAAASLLLGDRQRVLERGLGLVEVRRRQEREVPLDRLVFGLVQLTRVGVDAVLDQLAARVDDLDAVMRRSLPSAFSKSASIARPPFSSPALSAVDSACGRLILATLATCHSFMSLLAWDAGIAVPPAAGGVEGAGVVSLVPEFSVWASTRPVLRASAPAVTARRVSMMMPLQGHCGTPAKPTTFGGLPALTSPHLDCRPDRAGCPGRAPAASGLRRPGHLAASVEPAAHHPAPARPAVLQEWADHPASARRVVLPVSEDQVLLGPVSRDWPLCLRLQGLGRFMRGDNGTISWWFSVDPGPPLLSSHWRVSVVSSAAPVSLIKRTAAVRPKTLGFEDCAIR